MNHSKPHEPLYGPFITFLLCTRVPTRRSKNPDEPNRKASVAIMIPFQILCIFLASLPSVSAASTVVVGEFRIGGANAAPFGNDPDMYNLTYQQVYNNENFNNAPMTIRQVSFSSYSEPLGGGFAGYSANYDLVIKLGNSSRFYNTLSSDQSNNRMSNLTEVYSGAAAFNAINNAGENFFDFIINLQNQFEYNPMLGDLLMEVTILSGEVKNPLGNDGGFIAFGSSNQDVGRVYRNSQTTSYVVNDTNGLVTKFSSIPEPSSLIALSYLVVIGLTVRRRPRAPLMSNKTRHSNPYQPPCLHDLP